ncbi:MAG TPA: flagellar hook-length control protein FliK [Nitrospirae bacterium]|nr:flagellar hook-length control protein FliK [bacterium BMS3Abin08]HDO36580.1 flagellar hook-length control protein FliK [Nitrospirota bacterium]HDY72450.1 flagellar hook-length control protein FliK [Nitrospirota bacterium]
MITGIGKTLNISLKDGPVLSLKDGQTVRAVVLKRLSDNIFSIKIRGRIIETRSEIPLKEGDPLLLKVEAGGTKEIRLRLLEGQQDGSGKLKELILTALKSFKIAKTASGDLIGLKLKLEMLPPEVKEKIPEILQLERFLPEFSDLSPAAFGKAVKASGGFFETALRLLIGKTLLNSPEEEPPDPETVVSEAKDPGGKGMKEGVSEPRKGGAIKDGRVPSSAEKGPTAKKEDTPHAKKITGETPGKEVTALKGKDLKGILLTVKRRLGEEEGINALRKAGISGSEIRGAVERMIKNIEYHQFHSRLQESLQTYIPFLWKSLKDGELVFRKSLEKPEKDQPFSCMIKLDLESLGKVLVHVHLNSGRFHLRFITENSSFMEGIKESRSAVKEQFEAAGLRLESMIVSLREEIDFEKTGTDTLDLRI